MEAAFIEKFKAELPEGANVLDLGAGSGDYAKTLAESGLRVLAVDRLAAPFEHPNIVWRQVDIKEWIEKDMNGMFDGIFMRNIIQFFTSEYVRTTVLSRITPLLRNGGVIAIETFSRPPEPPFSKPHMSHWRLDELQKLFPEWEKLLSREFDVNGDDVKGTIRHFFLAQIIVRKPG